MTDRRRNLLILLTVLGLLIGSGVVIAAKLTRLGLDLKGGVELIYQGKPTKQSKVTHDALNRAIDIMRQRVDQLGVAEPEIQTLGDGQIEVSLPGTKDLQRAIRLVGTTAQMYFYDWEPSVIGPDGKPAIPNASAPVGADAQNVTGGQAAGSVGAGSLTHYDAVIRGSKRAPVQNHDDKGKPTDTTNGTWYLIGDQAKKVLRGPEDTRASLFSEHPNKPPGSRVVEVPPGTIVVQAEQPSKGPKPDAYFVLNDNPALKGTDVKNPQQNFDSGTGGSGQPIVTFDFTSHGKDVWQKVTRQIAQRGQASQLPGSSAQQVFQHFAVVLDNQLVTVPYIDFQANPDGIDATNGSQIQGSFTITSAQNLANQLKSGALPIKLDLISQSQVSATLGKQALHQGLIAGLIGFAVVCLFLLVFYRVLGVIAVGGLLVYSAYFFALIKLIPITLTLPGIAGLILTIGVAADANIVIFERVKEEIRGGRSIPAGIAAGYKRGLAAIVDANVVTFMAAFILFILAIAGIKGFAFVLGIGTLVSLFTAVLATQAILGTMGRSRVIAHPTALGVTETKQHWRYDFMGASRWFFSLSGLILLVGALSLGASGLKFGIDFESGTRITTALARPTNEAGVRTVLSGLGYGNAQIQKVSNKTLGSNGFQISAKIPPNKVIEVQTALTNRFGATPKFSSQSVGPTFGRTVANKGIIAIIASLLVISVYIALRFEWKYAVPVLIALMHDLLITSGVYSLTGREVTTSTVAALLTILGYSLYDTIIVFDRVRENVPRMPRAAFSQIVNRSMSEVLTRSLATSFCTLLPVGALLLLGGQTLKDFAFALFVGVASGAYSSIFIASPVLTHWKEREPVYEQRAARIINELGGIPPYATTADGKPMDVEPEVKRRRAEARVTTPDDPNAVSRAEFEEMVAEIQDDVTTGFAGGAQPAPAAVRDPTQDALPEDVVMPKEGNGAPKRQKPKRPRNKRHGRSR